MLDLTDYTWRAMKGSKEDWTIERSLLIGLEQIPEDKRHAMAEIREEFNPERPMILGGFLDAVMKTLNMPESRLRTYCMAERP